MTERAQVTSVDALKDFRANLIVYLSKARPALEEVNAELVRTRIWLENDQRLRWEAEFARRKRKFEEAQQALFDARMSQLRDVTVAEQVVVRKAKLALDEAEAKLRIIKKWARDFDQRVEPLAKQLGKLQTVLGLDTAKAIAWLAQAADTLDAYAGTGPTPAAGNPSVPPGVASGPVEAGATPAGQGKS